MFWPLAHSPLSQIWRQRPRTVVSNDKKPPKISLPKVISRVFLWKFLQIHITSVSGCLRFKLKICQNRCRHKYDSSISRFFESCFWRFFAIWPNCAAWRTAAKTSNAVRALVVKGAKRGNSNERRDCGTCHVIDGVVGRAINLILGDYILNILWFFFVNEILFPCASCCKKDFIDKNVALHIL